MTGTKSGTKTLKTGFAGLCIVALLSGCMGHDVVETTRKAFSNLSLKPAEQDPAQPALAGGAGGTGQNATSALIDGLLQRRSALQGEAYEAVSTAVLATNSRPAEAELRAAKLRAHAASKNWLPTIGPNLTLTSLSDVVTGIVVDQVLFSNGRKKAERAFAKADVEHAAVILAADTNTRVFNALELYVRAEEARGRVVALEPTRARLEQLSKVMARRVAGGVSDRADLQVIEQKLAELTNGQIADRQAARTAIAELNAMSLTPLDQISGLGQVVAQPSASKPLSVLGAETDRDRAVAQATIDRAGFLPTLSARGNITTDGSSAGINVGAENGIGFGTGSRLAAIDAAREAAGRKVAQADEDFARLLRRLEGRRVELTTKQANAAALLQQTDGNIALFERQYKAGVRPLMDLVAVYDSKARMTRELNEYRYALALLDLTIAREMGVLVDGEDI